MHKRLLGMTGAFFCSGRWLRVRLHFTLLSLAFDDRISLIFPAKYYKIVQSLG